MITKEEYDQQSEALNQIAIIVSNTPGLTYDIRDPIGASVTKPPEGARVEYGIDEAMIIEIWREDAWD